MKIGLALGGGGVLGAAHIGIIEAIEDAGLEIDIVSGVSAGALVGSIYCSEGLDGVKEFFGEIERDYGNKRFWNVPNYLIVDIENRLKKYLPKNFEDLERKFVTLAVDVSSGEGVTFEKGDLIEAVIASSSYPGVFPMRKIGDRYYVDGGVSASLPARIIDRNGGAFIIGSSLSQIRPLSDDKIMRLSKTDTMVRTLTFIEKRLNEIEMKHCDFVFEPPIHEYAWYHLKALKEIRKIGEDYGRHMIKELEKALNAKGQQIAKV